MTNSTPTSAIPPPTLPRKLTSADAAASASVMTQAFFDDPRIVYLWPDPAQRQRVVPRFYATVTRLGIEAGQAYGVGEPLSSFAAWGWPGQERAGMTPSNASLYERYGFKVMAQYDFAGKGLSVWSFLRPAQR